MTVYEKAKPDFEEIFRIMKIIVPFLFNIQSKTDKIYKSFRDVKKETNEDFIESGAYSFLLDIPLSALEQIMRDGGTESIFVTSIFANDEAYFRTPPESEEDAVEKLMGSMKKTYQLLKEYNLDPFLRRIGQDESTEYELRIKIP